MLSWSNENVFVLKYAKWYPLILVVGNLVVIYLFWYLFGPMVINKPENGLIIILAASPVYAPLLFLGISSLRVMGAKGVILAEKGNGISVPMVGTKIRADEVASMTYYGLVLRIRLKNAGKNLLSTNLVFPYLFGTRKSFFIPVGFLIGRHEDKVEVLSQAFGIQPTHAFGIQPKKGE